MHRDQLYTLEKDKIINRKINDIGDELKNNFKNKINRIDGIDDYKNMHGNITLDTKIIIDKPCPLWNYFWNFSYRDKNRIFCSLFDIKFYPYLYSTLKKYNKSMIKKDEFNKGVTYFNGEDNSYDTTPFHNLIPPNKKFLEEKMNYNGIKYEPFKYNKLSKYFKYFLYDDSENNPKLHFHNSK